MEENNQISGRESARGQFRTVETNWYNVAPYVRYRYERVLERLPAQGTVFELGCGIGVGLAYLSAQRSDLTFVGLETSQAAVEYGREHFDYLPNLELRSFTDYAELADTITPHAFLVALEVIEHHDDAQLEQFKTRLMPKVAACVFSFPYNEQNIEGTVHLQSFDIYRVFELFPGFEVVFIRRHSLKFIGYWERRPRYYIKQRLNVAKEEDAIARIGNFEASR